MLDYGCLHYLLGKMWDQKILLVGNWAWMLQMVIFMKRWNRRKAMLLPPWCSTVTSSCQNLLTMLCRMGSRSSQIMIWPPCRTISDILQRCWLSYFEMALSNPLSTFKWNFQVSILTYDIQSLYLLVNKASN